MSKKLWTGPNIISIFSFGASTQQNGKGWIMKASSVELRVYMIVTAVCVLCSPPSASANNGCTAGPWITITTPSEVCLGANLHQENHWAGEDGVPRDNCQDCPPSQTNITWGPNGSGPGQVDLSVSIQACQGSDADSKTVWVVDYDVTVPSFMTAKPGQTIQWPVTINNLTPGYTLNGSWTLTKSGCPTLTYNPSSKSFSTTDKDVEQVSITVDANTCAQNDAVMTVSATAGPGCPKSKQGNVCVIPQDETTIEAGMLWAGDLAQFNVRLEPTTANFSGRTVHEVQGNTWDECQGGVIPPFQLQGSSGSPSSWTIQSGNYYSSYDIIGYTGFSDPSEYILSAGRAPCSSGCKQEMWISCDTASTKYTEHDVSINVDEDGKAWISRDGVTQGPT